jgi:hypothetical protein
MNIAISGKMGTGKTTASDYIVHEYGFKRVALADPLKELENIHAHISNDAWFAHVMPIAIRLAANSNRPDSIMDLAYAIVECFSRHEQMPGKKNRGLLQELATDVIRSQFGNDIWVTYLVNTHLGEDRIVVDDLRFKNELKVFHDAGFITIRLEVPEDCRIQRLKELYGEVDEAKLNHISEWDLDDMLDSFDHIILNDAGIPATQKIIDKIIGKR